MRDGLADRQVCGHDEGGQRRHGLPRRQGPGVQHAEVSADGRQRLQGRRFSVLTMGKKGKTGKQKGAASAGGAAASAGQQADPLPSTATAAMASDEAAPALDASELQLEQASGRDTAHPGLDSPWTRVTNGGRAFYEHDDEEIAPTLNEPEEGVKDEIEEDAAMYDTMYGAIELNTKGLTLVGEAGGEKPEIRRDAARECTVGEATIKDSSVTATAHNGVIAWKEAQGHRHHRR